MHRTGFLVLQTGPWAVRAPFWGWLRWWPPGPLRVLKEQGGCGRGDVEGGAQDKSGERWLRALQGGAPGPLKLGAEADP